MDSSRTLAARGVMLCAGLFACSFVHASHPASSAIDASIRDRVQSSVSWTGQIPDAAESARACVSAGRFDTHSVLLATPQDFYAGNSLQLSARIEATGPTAPLTDLMLTLVRPDGSTANADAGVVRDGESLVISNPQAGEYELRACARGGATPQSYKGSLTLTTMKRSLTGSNAQPDANSRSLFFGLSADSACAAPDETIKFEQSYIDTTRAGGEPFIFTHPDGHLLWGSHAGTTHLYTPAANDTQTAAFIENYQGQTYYYVSELESNFEEWIFVPRAGATTADVGPVAGIPATGFSDPEFAVDSAGNVFVSEINLANIAVSKSTDGGRSYGLQNVLSLSVSDRQWTAADREDEFYMVASGLGGGSFGNTDQGNTGHYLTKSVDGGVTFFEAYEIDPLVGDIQIDKNRGILYSLHHMGGILSMARFPNIREENTDFTVEIQTIALGTGMSGVQRLIGPTFDMDAEGNLYVVWSENGTGGAGRPQGIYYAYSTDQAETWSLPQRVDPDNLDEVWPWVAVGAPGQVVVSWLQTDIESGESLPGEAGAGSTAARVQGQPDKPWHVMVAHSSAGLGCEDSVDDPGADLAAFTVTQASADPVHIGTICQHGTTCQADLTDRRLGDYFSIEVAGDGSVHVATGDTRRGGASALPLHIRQVGGPKLNAVPEAPPSVARAEPVVTASAPAPDATTRGGGSSSMILLIGLIGLWAAFARTVFARAKPTRRR